MESLASTGNSYDPQTRGETEPRRTGWPDAHFTAGEEQTTRETTGRRIAGK